MKKVLLIAWLLALFAIVVAQAAPATPARTNLATLKPADAIVPDRETRTVAGWTVHINRGLLTKKTKPTERALILLQKQLEEIVCLVPAKAVAELQKVPLYLSPEYPGQKPTAEFHPDAGWLRQHGRDPAMAKAVEFTNVRIFERELNRNLAVMFGRA